jgi:hypothetical protein
LLKSENDSEKLREACGHQILLLKGLTPLQIKEELGSALTNSSPPYSVVEQWVSEFKKDHI